MGKLTGKVAIITGSGSGIGQATAILFAKEGARVVICCRTIENGEDTVRLIKEAEGEGMFVRTDMSKAGEVYEMVKSTVDAYGRLDILINNAAISEEEGSTVSCTEETFDKTIAINLKGTWLGMKYAVPEMLKIGAGSIINLSSVVAMRFIPGIPAYSASKAGIIALSKVAATEYANRNIRVNVVVPGPTSSQMLLNKWAPEKIRKFQQVTPLQRLAKPEEVAYACLFLACGESSFITGETIHVNGGQGLY